ARDLDNDGVPDSGGDFWTADIFHTRDVIRQSVLDHMVLIRALRSFDGRRRSTQVFRSAGQPGLAGDFDGDGVVDLGGPDNDYYAWGQSLGGFFAAILPAVEPTITAAAPTSGGGGLVELGLRS